MQTQCPYCQTLFQISEEQLLTANGKAHCCRCDRIFNARENLRETAATEQTPATPPPLTEQKWSEPVTEEAPPSAEPEQMDPESMDREVDQGALEISGAHPFEKLLDGDGFGGIPQLAPEFANGPLGADPISGFQIEPSPLDPDQGFSSAYGEEAISGGLPDLDGVTPGPAVDAIPTFLIDPEQQEENGGQPRQPEYEAPLDPMFGEEFIRSQLAEAESIAADPEADTTEATTEQDYTDSGVGEETSLEAASLLQQREPVETESDSESNDDRQIQRDQGPEPLTPIQESLQTVEVSEDEALYPEELIPTPEKRTKGRGIAWAVAALVLLLLAAGQAGWLARDHLIQYPAARELLASFCQLAGCKLQKQRAPDRLEILDRSVASHPQIPDALQILLTLSNQAGFPQPFPEIQLSLFNTKDELLARRRFQPEEYLDQVATRKALLQPKLPVRLEILLQDPGEEATGFKFDFF